MTSSVKNMTRRGISPRQKQGLTDLKQEMEAARSAVKDACLFLSGRFGKGTEVLNSAGRDIKTKVDQEAEQLILEKLRSGFDYPALSEESEVVEVIGRRKKFWVVDPLDGTLNFVRGIPFSAVSVGLWKGEEPLLGVVGEIHSGRQYYGVRGEKVWADGEAQGVSGITVLKEAVVATGFPVHGSFNEKFLSGFTFLGQRAKKIRMLGSAALSLAYLGCGKVDAYFEEGIMLWDVAAGALLVKTAGGSVWVEKNPRHRWARNVYAASSEALFRELLKAKDLCWGD